MRRLGIWHGHKGPDTLLTWFTFKLLSKYGRKLPVALPMRNFIKTQCKKSGLVLTGGVHCPEGALPFLPNN